ncbi:MAG: L-2-hydroxyglutarate oxidase [Planctomycetota bacterium]
MQSHPFTADVPLVTVIGGGIVGLATAMTLKERRPELTVALLESESELAQHQTGHNSGVIHSGIYYRPGSDKALLCRRGKAMMEGFCRSNSVPWDRCGKVVVATRESELPMLERIAERANENGVEFSRIGTDRLRELEPQAAGVAALEVPETGIVDYAVVARAMAERFRDQGGVIRTGFRVTQIHSEDKGLHLRDGGGNAWITRTAINCAGLHSDAVFRQAKHGVMANVADKLADAPECRIIPFRGEYYELVQSRWSLVRNLIYPVPDPNFPFLGVHFTRMIGGGVECGPNAVLALARHGYRWRDVSLSDLGEMMRFPGAYRLMKRHWRMGIAEMHRSISKAAFVAALQRLLPAVRSQDLMHARAGVRAQAVDAGGNLIDDFLFASTPAFTHVLNAPSPAATASLAIAERVVDQHQARWGSLWL